MKKIFYVLLMLPVLNFANDTSCGQTFNTQWKFMPEAKKVTLVAVKRFDDKFCDGKGKNRTNTLFEFFDKNKKLLFSKKLFVQMMGFYDSSSQQGELTGGIHLEKEVYQILKIPLNKTTGAIETYKVTDLNSKKVLGEGLFK